MSKDHPIIPRVVIPVGMMNIIHSRLIAVVDTAQREQRAALSSASTLLAVQDARDAAKAARARLLDLFEVQR